MFWKCVRVFLEAPVSRHSTLLVIATTQEKALTASGQLTFHFQVLSVTPLLLCMFLFFTSHYLHFSSPSELSACSLTLDNIAPEVFTEFTSLRTL